MEEEKIHVKSREAYVFQMVQDLCPSEYTQTVTGGVTLFTSEKTNKKINPSVLNKRTREPIKVYLSVGEVPVESMLDSGSDLSIISPQCVKRLNLPVQPSNVSVRGYDPSGQEGQSSSHLFSGEVMVEVRHGLRILRVRLVVGELPSPWEVLVGRDIDYLLGIEIHGLHDGYGSKTRIQERKELLNSWYDESIAAGIDPLTPDDETPLSVMISSSRRQEELDKEFIENMKPTVDSVLLRNSKVKGFCNLHTAVVELKIKEHRVAWKAKSQRFPDVLKPSITKVIDDWMESGKIEEVKESTPYNLRLVIASKKNKDGITDVVDPKTGLIEVRVCLDLRPVNQHLDHCGDGFPLPVMTEMLVEMQGSDLFSELDVKAAFQQFLVHL
jgi:hypothetical protein